MLEIFLVHGTWSNKSVWSPALLEQIQYYLRSAGFSHNYTIHKFEWDGKLSNRSRERAAGRLNAEINTVQNNNPDHKIILIGHSHGGNVALLTTKGIGGRIKKPDMLITLAMPLMGFYSREYIGAKKTYWLNIHCELDGIQWLAGFGRKWFHRMDDGHADKNIVIPFAHHTTIEKFPPTWKLITEEIKLHFLEMDAEEK